VGPQVEQLGGRGVATYDVPHRHADRDRHRATRIDVRRCHTDEQAGDASELISDLPPLLRTGGDEVTDRG
jgi:hypothetical protein